MLNCHIIASPELKDQVYQNLSDMDRCWVVSDLESKFWMQTFLREKKQTVMASDRVLRASELWQKFLLQIDPQWQVLSPILAKLLIEKWMSEITYGNLSQKDSRRAYQTIGQILPLLTHEQAQDVMGEWFEEDSKSKDRWENWYLMGSTLWQAFAQKKMIPMEWMKAVLINEELDHLPVDTYVFDLGLEMDDVESELALNLSRTMDVDIIIPEAEKDNEVYSQLIARCHPQYYSTEHGDAQKTYKKFPSMLSEVKEVVAQVRQWLDAGIAPESIAILSPVIENYWPTLSEYLIVEGIPVDKDVVTPLSQIEVYQSWLAKMRIALGKMQGFEGEQIFFSETESPKLSYKDYKTLFTNIYDVADFKRSNLLSDDLPTHMSPQKRVKFGEFLQWSLSLLSDSQWVKVLQRIGELDEAYGINEEFPLEMWVQYLENYFSRSEKTIEQGQRHGVAVLSLTAAAHRPFQKMAILGLSESNLVDDANTALHWTDIETIKTKFGFNLPHPDRLKMESLLHWLEKKNVQEFILMHSETDFTGAFQAPSVYWLQGALREQASLDLHSPSATRWDQVMQSDPLWLQRMPVENQVLCANMVDRDLGLAPYPNIPFHNLSLSASSLEEYFKCPFRFYALKGLGLSDLPSLDIDIDHMTKGQLIHKICEIIVADGNFSLSIDVIDGIVERARTELEMVVYSDEIWKFLKPYYVKTTKGFVQFEQQWRKEYPHTQTFALEQEVQTKISVENGDIRFSQQGEIPFRGYIDRIDTNGEGQYVILDYKSSGYGLTQPSSWLKNGSLQLAIYSLALIEGSIGNQAMDVVGAFYYVLKDLDRKKGAAITEADPSFIPSKKFSREDWLRLLGETKTMVNEIIESIMTGRIQTQPHKEKQCEQCDWSDLCRYPALNH